MIGKHWDWARKHPVIRISFRQQWRATANARCYALRAPFGLELIPEDVTNQDRVDRTLKAAARNIVERTISAALA